MWSTSVAGVSRPAALQVWHKCLSRLSIHVLMLRQVWPYPLLWALPLPPFHPVVIECLYLGYGFFFFLQ